MAVPIFTLPMLLLMLVLLVLPKGNDCLSFDPAMNRRSAFKTAASISSSAATVAATGGAATGWLIRTTDDDAQASSLPSSNDSLLAYQVFPDATPKRDPTLKPVTVSERKDL